MEIDRDIPIAMDDGLVLRADAFRPAGGSPCPVILSYGPYGKGLAFTEGYPDQWRILCERHPDVLEDSTNRLQNWEVVDPELWVAAGYACVRVDSRGAGRSPGHLDPWSPRETHDLYHCIEWAAEQPWSNGRVGLNGISYFAMNQWLVASLQPPHLRAICVWEGAADFYRDTTHHGGILCINWDNWYEMQVLGVQHGAGDPAVSGPETLDASARAASRSDLPGEIRAHPLDDDWHRARSAVWDRIDVPLLSASNWGGQALHARGNFEGFVRAASEEKWLEVHGGEHWAWFYTRYGVALQQRFFGHFLKGEDTGWSREPRVRLHVPRVDGSFVERHESEWPLARTQWTRLYLHGGDRTLREGEPADPAVAGFAALEDSVEFTAPAFAHETEITGPAAAKLYVSSTTADADLFLVLRLLDPDGAEVVFQGSNDPRTALGKGWLRASQRKLDPELSEPYRPYHAHDERQPLEPGEVYELDIEIWPVSAIIPAGHRVALLVKGRDLARSSGARLANFRVELRGSGPYLHDDRHDRPAERFGGRTTIHTGPQTPSSLLLPVVPAA